MAFHVPRSHHIHGTMILTPHIYLNLIYSKRFRNTTASVSFAYILNYSSFFSLVIVHFFFRLFLYSEAAFACLLFAVFIVATSTRCVTFWFVLRVNRCLIVMFMYVPVRNLWSAHPQSWKCNDSEKKNMEFAFVYRESYKECSFTST